MFKRKWHVVSYDLQPWGIDHASQKFVSAHFWRWFANQAQGMYYEHQSDHIGPRAPEGFIPKAYRVEKAL